MPKLTIKHNLQPEELRKAITAMAESSGIADQVIETLQKAKACDDAPKEPQELAMRELYRRFQAEFHKATAWIVDDALPGILGATIEKAVTPLPRPLTKEEVQRILQAIRDRFDFIAAQMQTDFTPPQDILDRWKTEGLISQDVTPESFALTVNDPNLKLINNAFCFGRLHQAMEHGASYADILHLALTMPLKKPDLYAIAIAEQQTAMHITAMGEHLATEAGRLMAARNRAIIQQMAIQYHKQALPAKVLDIEAKQEFGIAIPEKLVDTWRGFSSELYHRMEDKARDWDRVAYFEIYDAKGQGQAMDMVETLGAEQLVYKQPLPTACPQCKYLYLEEDGTTPRLFRVGDLLQHGNNIGRKPHPVSGGQVVPGGRPDGQETLLPVTGQIHPWCQCVGPIVYTGHEPWAKQRIQKSRAVPGVHLIKSHVKAHERMSASGKMEMVRDYDDKRTKAETPAPAAKQKQQPEPGKKKPAKAPAEEVKHKGRLGYPQRPKASQAATSKAVEGKLPKVLYHGTSAPEFDQFKNGLTFMAPDQHEADAYAHNPIIGGGRGQGRPRVLKITPSPGRVKDITKTTSNAVQEGEDMEQHFAKEAERAKKQGFRYLQFHHPSTVPGRDEFPATISMYPQEDLHIENEPGQGQEHQNEAWHRTKQGLDKMYRRMSELRDEIAKQQWRPDKKVTDELASLRARSEKEEKTIRQQLREALDAGKDVPKDVLSNYGVQKKPSTPAPSGPGRTRQE